MSVTPVTAERADAWQVRKLLVRNRGDAVHVVVILRNGAERRVALFPGVKVDRNLIVDVQPREPSDGE